MNRALHNQEMQDMAKKAGNSGRRLQKYLQKPDLQRPESGRDTKSSEVRLSATDEQNKYADMLSIGRKIGLAAILIALGIYVMGVIPPKVPVSALPQYWGLSSKEFMSNVGLQPGWSWVGLYKYSDIMNYFGVAILGAISAICYAAIIPGLLRKKDYAYVLIAIAEVLVLVLAASGIVNIGE